jgi:predicted PurR-regulated permease PerM
MEKIEISHKTIIFTILFLIFLWFLWQIREILLIVFISFIAMTALNPLINKMEKIKIPRPLAILFIYLVLFGLLAGLVASIVPMLVSQTNSLLDALSGLGNKFNLFGFQINLGDYNEHLAKIPGNLVKIIASTFNNLLKFFTFLVITFYLLIERKKMKEYLHILFRNDGEQQAEEMINKLEVKIGGWVRGQIILMFIVGLMSYFGLLLLDLEFALPLAVFAGALEIVPNLGPTLAMVPAAIVGLSMSPIMGLTVVALYFLIQQLENNFIVPKVMEKSIGVNPLVSLLVLITGLKIAGPLGMFLAIPVFLTLQILLKEFYKLRAKKQ